MSILIRTSKESRKEEEKITKRGKNTYFFVTCAGGIESIEYLL